MARPMLLIKEKLLMAMYDKYKAGVPVLAIIRQHDIGGSVTGPTLIKLFSYLKAFENMDSEAIQSIVNDTTTIKQTIHNSLFPHWLVHSKDEITTSPATYYYIGKMPLGKWLLKEGK